MICQTCKQPMREFDLTTHGSVYKHPSGGFYIGEMPHGKRVHEHDYFEHSDYRVCIQRLAELVSRSGAAANGATTGRDPAEQPGAAKGE
jgi:hypothetical protein